MPVISQFIAIIVAMMYLVSASVTNKLGHTLLVFRSVLPEGACGRKFNERVLGSLPELPAPLLVRVAFVAEQAMFLWTTAILLLLLALSPLAADLLQDHSAPPGHAANLPGGPGDGTGSTLGESGEAAPPDAPQSDQGDSHNGTMSDPPVECSPDTPGCFNPDEDTSADHARSIAASVQLV